MKQKRHALGISLLLLVFGLFLMGCPTPQAAVRTFEPIADPEATEVVFGTADIYRITAWSHQTVIPHRDFVVVGAVSLRDVNEATLLADLMDRAIAMGGHDIINVRVGMVTETVVTEIDGRIEWEERSRVNNATAVVIQYTAERWQPDVLGRELMMLMMAADDPVSREGVADLPIDRGGFLRRMLGQ